MPMRNVFVRNVFAAFVLTAGSLLLSITAEAASQGGLECTLIKDLSSGTVRRDGVCDQPLSPFSTFKLTLALIGYDAGILTGETAPAWDYKPEYQAAERDRKTVDPVIWERDSVLWYSREIVRRLGEKTFADYVQRLGYGNADVSGDRGKDNGLTHSWLGSSLAISPEQQLDFVERMLAGDLPVSARAIALTEKIIPSFEAEDGWVLHGKTGSGSLRKDGKIDRSRPLGWFIGWAEKDGKRYVFVRASIGTKKSGPRGLQVRKDFIADFPGLMRAGG